MVKKTYSPQSKLRLRRANWEIKKMHNLDKYVTYLLPAPMRKTIDKVTYWKEYKCVVSAENFVSDLRYRKQFIDSAFTHWKKHLMNAAEEVELAVQEYEDDLDHLLEASDRIKYS
jgi:hypothetical protein